MTGLGTAPSMVYRLGMEKPVECKACRRWFRVAGERDKAEKSRTINCPNCGEPNEVYWPMNMEVAATEAFASMIAYKRDGATAELRPSSTAAPDSCPLHAHWYL